VFGALPPKGLPDHDAAADMQQRCHELLAAAGFARYETSAFARAGRRCVHNLNYWTFGDYLGVGAGAHGKRSDMAHQRIERTTREREPRRYMARGARGLAPSKVIRASELPFEFMMNALRLTDGFSSALFEERTGQKWSMVALHMKRLAERGLVIEEPAGHWRASPRGAAFLNELLLEFMDMPRATRSGLGRKTPEGPVA
jgi:coproporphyrinogen III oxidase-like Fe-S oxidoreductase